MLFWMAIPAHHPSDQSPNVFRCAFETCTIVPAQLVGDVARLLVYDARISSGQGIIPFAESSHPEDAPLGRAVSRHS